MEIIFNNTKNFILDNILEDEQIDLSEIFKKQAKLISTFQPTYKTLLEMCNSFILFTQEELNEVLDEILKIDFSKEKYNDELIYELVDVLMYLISFYLEVNGFITFMVDNDNDNYIDFLKLSDTEKNNLYNYELTDNCERTKLFYQKIISKENIINENEKVIENYKNILIDINSLFMDIRKLFPERKYHKQLKDYFSDLEKCFYINSYLEDTIISYIIFLINSSLIDDINFKEYVFKKQDTFI